MGLGHVDTAVKAKFTWYGAGFRMIDYPNFIWKDILKISNNFDMFNLFDF